MFGNKDVITFAQLEETLAPLLRRLDDLEKTLKGQAHQIEELERQLNDRNASSPVVDANTSSIGYPADEKGDGQVHAQPSSDAALAIPTTAQTLFLPAPTADGQFLESSSQEQVGKSIYQLRTEDGVNGQFIMLSTPDAIATAMISVSQFVKPVCRIEGNTHQQPRSITTLEEGLAICDGGVWKVTRKARVVFE